MTARPRQLKMDVGRFGPDQDSIRPEKARSNTDTKSYPWHRPHFFGKKIRQDMARLDSTKHDKCSKISVRHDDPARGFGPAVGPTLKFWPDVAELIQAGFGIKVL